ncbi:glycosyl hydrolase family 65 central catalytic domain-containing protein, partial [Neofusicoccum parvum]
MKLGFLPLILLVEAVGAAGPFDLPAEFVSWDDSTNTLTSTRPFPGSYQAWIPQSNGYIGLGQASLGPFYEASANNDTEGWMLFSPRQTFATVVGFWDAEPSGDSVISGIPHFTDLLVEACGSVLNGSVDVSQISGFSSSISFTSGLATWSYAWAPAGCAGNASLNIHYESFLSTDKRQLAAVKLSVSSSHALEIGVVDVLDGRSANRTTLAEKKALPESNSIMAAVHPTGLQNVAAYVRSTVTGAGQASRSETQNGTSTISQHYRLRLTPNTEATVFKYVGIASTDHFPAAAYSLATTTALTAPSQGWPALLSAHSAHIATLTHANHVADFRDPTTHTLPSDPTIRALQITAKASAYYLYTSLLPAGSPGAASSIAVGGLTTEAYGGKVFWDADVFVAPAVMGAVPALGRGFGAYRVARAAQAARNTARHGLRAGSMLFPWTSGREGECYNITAPCVMYEYHLNADVALALVMARNTSGDVGWFGEGAEAVVDGVAMGLGEVLSWYAENGTWGIEVMTDADEYYMFVSDGAFTDAAVSVTLEIASNLRRAAGKPLEENWVNMTENMQIPTSESGVVMEFRDMWNDLVSKQADVILMDYPFDYRRNFSLEKRRLAMDYYSVRQDRNGPAMTYALYAISANSLSESGCSFWTFLKKSFEPYIRAPWYQFSEQQLDDPAANGGTNPAFPFLTGHGGFLQVMTAGFLGLRVTDEHLVLNPSLPPQLSHFRAPIQFYNGAVIACTMNATHTTITRRDARLHSAFALAPDRYGATPMPITLGRAANTTHPTLRLHINETATVPNRAYHTTTTLPHNLLQCRRARSPAPHLPGQFPLAAVDGSAGTAWQPARGDAPAALVVALPPPP